MNIRKTIKSLRNKNNKNFGYKIISEEINNENEYNKNVIYLDLNGNETTEKPFTWNEINKELNILIAEYNAKQYQRDRAKAYPSIQEQLDMQYWDKVNGTDNWEQAINAVKAKYPKA